VQDAFPRRIAACESVVSGRTLLEIRLVEKLEDGAAAFVAQANNRFRCDSLRVDRRTHDDFEATAPRQPCVRREQFARASNHDGDDWQSRTICRRKRTGMEPPKSRLAPERSFGKEGECFAGGSGTENATRVHSATVAFEALHELRPNTAQQEMYEWNTRHFALDHEAEAGRQGGGEDHAVEIARVIRDDDAGPRIDLLGADRRQRDARDAERNARAATGKAPAALQSGRDEEQDETDDRDDADGDDRVQAIDAICVTGSRLRGLFGKRMRIHKTPSETVTGFKLMSMRHVNRITADPVSGPAYLQALRRSRPWHCGCVETRPGPFGQGGGW